MQLRIVRGGVGRRGQQRARRWAGGQSFSPVHAAWPQQHGAGSPCVLAPTPCMPPPRPPLARAGPRPGGHRGDQQRRVPPRRRQRTAHGPQPDQHRVHLPGRGAGHAHLPLRQDAGRAVHRGGGSCGAPGDRRGPRGGRLPAAAAQDQGCGGARGQVGGWVGARWGGVGWCGGGGGSGGRGGCLLPCGAGERRAGGKGGGGSTAAWQWCTIDLCATAAAACAAASHPLPRPRC